MINLRIQLRNMTASQRGHTRDYLGMRGPYGPEHPQVHRQSRQPATPRWGSGLSVAVTVVFALAANVLAVSAVRVPFLGPAIGFWFLVVNPIYLLYTTDIWGRSNVIERVAYSVTGVLLWLMLGGLVINTVLPWLGDTHPLASLPLTVISDLVTIALYWFRQRRPALPDWREWRRSLSIIDIRLLTTAIICPVLAVLGANRLNNGSNDVIALAALAVVLLAVLMLLRWHRIVSDEMTGLALYFIGIALLLQNSLRGWYVTGHDIQTEYRVFQLAEAQNHWNVGSLHSAYSACLSITILPTEIENIVHIDDPYVFKFFFQVLFALCPALVYTISRRFAPKLFALLASIFFIGLPTFFTDMPFLNRQEMAFLFVCAALLSITNGAWPERRRRIYFYIATAGIELSHYSTTYLFFGTIVISLLIPPVVRQVSRIVARHRGIEPDPWFQSRRTLGFGSVVAVGAAILLWGGLATHTSGALLTQLKAAASQITSTRASTSYSLFSGPGVSPQEALDELETADLKQNVNSPPGLYIPVAIAEQYQTPILSEPNLPLTSIGKILSWFGVPITGLNTAVRQGAAKDEQLFVMVGFLAVLFSRRLRRRISPELLFIAFGGIVTVAFFAVFPSLASDYGVLRAFQEALIVAASVMVIGSVVTFSPFGMKRAVQITTGVTVLFFISTIGLMPQVLGGYPAQLGLNNSGRYYDIFFTQPQEVAAVNWLSHQPNVLPTGIQAPMGQGTAGRFAFNTRSTVDGKQFISDIYPPLVMQSSWVVLNYSIIHNGRAPIFLNGNQYTYKYPTAFLQTTKNLVFNNGGSEIYK